MPKVSGALNFYGLLDDEAKVSLLPTRWYKDHPASNGNTSAYYGSAFFDGSYVIGAKQVKDILLTDIERLTAALNSADAGAMTTQKLGGKSVTYKASKLKLILHGAGFDVKLTQDKDEEDFVTLSFEAPAKMRTVDVTVTASKESANVTEAGKTTYTVQSLWSKIAAVHDKVGYNLGETVYFNGLPKTFEGLVQPIHLEEGDYSLVAIEANENTLSKIAELGEYVEGELTEVGEYDFYIIPASEELSTFR
jgi:hypothetical protein